MKSLFALIAFTAVIMNSSSVSSQQIVSGYLRSNGTYVSPYIRSTPDSYKFNNYGCMTPKR